MGTMNQYEQAIFEVGSVLEPYSLDNKFHMLGFGGAPNYMEDPADNGKISKCWNLNGMQFANTLGGKVQGIPAMLKTYHNAVMYTKLAGPTYFESLLR